MQQIQSTDSGALIARLQSIVGRRHVLVDDDRTRRYTNGYRFGGGPVLAVIRPGTLVEQWLVLEACVAARVIIIAQAANTGLTGGSTPDGSYDRPVIIINTLRIKGVHLIDDGQQAVCLPGTTLYELEALLSPLGREPHSVIGSSCFGASVIGGVCNNSGGALVRRGPAYTQLALYARVDERGCLRLVNHLGIDLGTQPHEILTRLEGGHFSAADIERARDRQASDHNYAEHVRDIDAPTPARFNADPTRLYEASGSGGKVMVFAVRLDTFPKETMSQVFYIGTNNPAELTLLRRDILSSFQSLPIAAEYMHRDAFDVAATYGKDSYLAIRHFGTERLPLMIAAKAWLDRLATRIRFLPDSLSDRLLQHASSLFPQHLPRRIVDWRDRYEHHLMIRVAKDDVEEMMHRLLETFPSADGDFFACTPDEGEAAFLHRFVAAGAAVRYRAVNDRIVEDIVALDVALPRNCRDWTEQLPEDIAGSIIQQLRYGHFLCFVFHQDYIVRKGADPATLEHAMLALLDKKGAEYPAEHNVGHIYTAKTALRDHYEELDPCNVFNPGIGGTDRMARAACYLPTTGST